MGGMGVCVSLSQSLSTAFIRYRHAFFCVCPRFSKNGRVCALCGGAETRHSLCILCSDLRTTHGATPQPLPHVRMHSSWLSAGWSSLGAAAPCSQTSTSTSSARDMRGLSAWRIYDSIAHATSYFQPSGRMSEGRKYGMNDAARAMPNQPPGTLFTAAMKPVLTWGQSYG